MTQDVRVRIGFPEEEEAILDMAIKGWEENGINSADREKMRGMIRPALYLHEGMVGVIGERGGKLEAAIVLRTGKLWYSDDWILEEKAIYVDPEFRKAKLGRARMLIEFSKKVSDGLGIPLLIGVLSTHRTKGKVKLYERQFGESAGAFFLYGVKTGLQNSDPSEIGEN